MTAITITTLSENTARHGFIGEWGLSILVDVEGTRILLDAGWSFSAVYNAQLLSIDLNSIDIIVLSHGHRDHTGGLPGILKRRSRPVEIIAHPDIWSNRYTHFDTVDEYSGISFNREYLESLGAQFRLTKDPVQITPLTLTTGEIPMLNDFETAEHNLLVKTGDTLTIDPIADDQSLIINTDEGLVIITGCAHRGIINTLQHARNLTGRDKVYVVIGGTHLYRASQERIALTIAALQEAGVKKLGVSHCTGFPASSMLYSEFPDSFFLNNAGTRTSLP